MEFRILGPLEVLDGDRALEVAGLRQRSLLALLLLHANQVVSASRLIEELWPEETTESHAGALQASVSRLRKSLGPGAELLATLPTGYVIKLIPEQLDLDRFERLVQEAGETGPQEAAEQLREALALWRGPPLADFAYEPFAQLAIGRLEELRLDALERRIEADLALGRHAEVVAELGELVALHPLRERFRAELMVALYRSNRQVEALDAYRSARQSLVEELGIEPSPTLQELERAVLRQDPALDVEPAGTPGRSILVVPRHDAQLGPLLALAAPLARRPVRDLVLVHIVSPGELGRASEELAARSEQLRAQGLGSRVAAFTSNEPGRDVVRLAWEQDVDLILLAGSLDPEVAIVVADAPCDVGVLLGLEKGRSFDLERPIVVPFGGTDHDWTAVELATWVAQAHELPVRLVGVERGAGSRDASSLLASVSLIVQRVAGITTEALLAEAGEEGLVRAAEDAAFIVFGLPAGWREHGPGEVREAVVRRAAAPTLLVRKGIRPGGLAPETSRTRFTWSLRS
jgi:DNA-binding SARP family transcriptional activator